VREWSIGHDEYWGKIGHFAIGWKTCDVVTGNLGNLMNADRKTVKTIVGMDAITRMGWPRAYWSC